MTDKDFPYADILRLPHHRTAGRAHMSLHDRAAQFASFAALTGFDGVIAETGRQTERRVELSESEKALLGRKLARIIDCLQRGRHPTVTVAYFEADARKGGRRVQAVFRKGKKDRPVRANNCVHGGRWPLGRGGHSHGRCRGYPK